MNNNPPELIPRPQAARLLREMCPEATGVIANACWLAYKDGREECTLAELIEALQFYMPQAGRIRPAKRDFRVKHP